MDITASPLFTVTNNGIILVKQSTYLMLFDSEFNCILSMNDFTWGGRFLDISSSTDLMYANDNTGISAFNNQADLIWKTDLPEYQNDYRDRTIQLSNTGSFLAVTDEDRLYLYDAIDGELLSEIITDDRMRDPVFSQSDDMLLVAAFTDPLLTHNRPVHSFGLRLIPLRDNSIGIFNDLSISNSSADSSMPRYFTSYCVSDTGYIIGFLYYNPEYVRFALLSPEMDFLWLSSNKPEEGFLDEWLIQNQQGISQDNSTFWYFDGVVLHSCSIEM
jgi:hypothetical protein